MQILRVISIMIKLIVGVISVKVIVWLMIVLIVVTLVIKARLISCACLKINFLKGGCVSKSIFIDNNFIHYACLIFFLEKHLNQVSLSCFYEKRFIVGILNTIFDPPSLCFRGLHALACDF